MKQILVSLCLLGSITDTAFAAQPHSLPVNSGIRTIVGFSYSLKDAFGTQFEFDLSKLANNAPISVQFFWKIYQQRIDQYTGWDTNGTGLAALYDLSSPSSLKKALHPYAGLGLISVAHSWAGMNSAPNYNGKGSGIYITGGVKYNLSSQISTDFSYNNFGGLKMGANFSF
jgi:hypothetical protein